VASGANLAALRSAPRNGGVRGYVGAIQLEFIASGAEAQNCFQGFVARVNSCPSLTRWAWELLPPDGHPELRGFDEM
jgi:hypothetical protein